MSDCESLFWNRGDEIIVWNGNKICSPGAVLWASALPRNSGLALVTLFDENTPPDVPNAFIYNMVSGFTPLKVDEEGRFVRFLGCYAENNRIVFNAANETEYLVDPTTLEVQSTRYYR